MYPRAMALFGTRLLQLVGGPREFLDQLTELALNEGANQLVAVLCAHRLARPFAGVDPSKETQQQRFSVWGFECRNKRGISFFPSRFEKLADGKDRQ